MALFLWLCALFCGARFEAFQPVRTLVPFHWDEQWRVSESLNVMAFRRKSRGRF
jgi:hypothetical protein